MFVDNGIVFGSISESPPLMKSIKEIKLMLLERVTKFEYSRLASKLT